MSYNDVFKIDATLVANEFLDKYMPTANGDYVKVYLYLLRNHVNGIDIETVAEKLALTEGDVRRAIRYWEKCGIVSVGQGAHAGDGEISAEPIPGENSGDEEGGVPSAETAVQKTAASGRTGRRSAAGKKAVPAAAAEEKQSADAEAGSGDGGKTQAPPEGSRKTDADGEIRGRYRRVEGKDALNRLSEDADFGQLLFAVAKYRSKILTESDEQVLAYLYDGIGMPVDVLDYLVQYCVESGHPSMRYIEKTGLDWTERNVRTVRDARRLTKEFEKAKAGSAARKTAKKDKAGITRGEDLDTWLTQVVKRNIR